MQWASLCKITHNPSALVTLEYEVYSGSFQEAQSLFCLSGSPLKPGKSHTFSTSLKWTWKISPVLLNPHSACNKYTTVRPSPERQRESFTPRHIWWLDFTCSISCISALLSKKWVAVWIYHNPASPMAPERRQEMIFGILKTHFTASPSGASFQIRSQSQRAQKQCYF